jgi:hypothetical protein
MSLRTALADLEKDDIVVRKQLGRKHVEYRVNERHPEVRSLVSVVRDIRAAQQQTHTRFEELLDHWREHLSEKYESPALKKTIIKLLTYDCAWRAASFTTELMFLTAQITSDGKETLLGEEVFQERLARTIVALRRQFVMLLAEDRKTTNDTFRTWLEEARTNRNRFVKQLVPSV